MSSAPAVVKAQPASSIEGILKSKAFTDRLQLYASTINPGIFAASVLNQIRKVPKLAKCTQESFFDALVTCAQLGILPNGRDAHLIPFDTNRKDAAGNWSKKTECQLIIDWKGLAGLAYKNSDLVEPIYADVVCANDVFEYNMGRVLRHTWKLTEDRGEVVGAYAIAKFKSGGERHDLLSLRDIEKARAASKNADKGPWVAWYEEMAKKTAVRRLSKYLQLAPEVVEALDAEDRMNSIDIKPAHLSISEPAATDTTTVEEEPPTANETAEEEQKPSEPPATKTAPAAINQYSSPVQKGRAEIAAFVETLGKAGYAVLGAQGFENANEVPPAKLDAVLEALRAALAKQGGKSSQGDLLD